jgi:hypothetical protein
LGTLIVHWPEVTKAAEQTDDDDSDSSRGRTGWYKKLTILVFKIGTTIEAINGLRKLAGWIAQEGHHLLSS